MFTNTDAADVNALAMSTAHWRLSSSGSFISRFTPAQDGMIFFTLFFIVGESEAAKASILSGATSAL